MQETRKCRNLRQQRGDFVHFLRGRGIDIGCGDDVLQIDEGNVRPWDEPDGDAQFMAGAPNNEFDFVYSSHCLEHLCDVRESLSNWARILKPGGFLYVVVPDYVLYEKMTWPSMFNMGHKQSFSFMVPRHAVGRTNHYHMEMDMVPLLKDLGLHPLRFTVEDMGFNYNLGPQDQTKLGALSQLCFVGRKGTA